MEYCVVSEPSPGREFIALGGPSHRTTLRLRRGAGPLGGLGPGPRHPGASPPTDAGEAVAPQLRVQPDSEPPRAPLRGTSTWLLSVTSESRVSSMLTAWLPQPRRCGRPGRAGQAAFLLGTIRRLQRVRPPGSSLGGGGVGGGGHHARRAALPALGVSPAPAPLQRRSALLTAARSAPSIC